METYVIVFYYTWVINCISNKVYTYILWSINHSKNLNEEEYDICF